MAEQQKDKPKKFRVAVSGTTVDGREITPEQIRQMATTYNPQMYGARVNIEHYLSPVPGSDFSAMGDVSALSCEDLTEGPLAGRTALYAEIDASDRMKKLTDDGKKVFSSIEFYPQFAATGGAYLAGLAMTDTPASLGTDRLKFAARQRAEVMTFTNRTEAPPMFTEAMEAELIELTERDDTEGKQWYSRIMGLITHRQRSDSESFSQLRQAVEQVALSQVGVLDEIRETAGRGAALDQLTAEVAELKEKLSKQDASTFSRPVATGGNAAIQLTDY